MNIILVGKALSKPFRIDLNARKVAYAFAVFTIAMVTLTGYVGYAIGEKEGGGEAQMLAEIDNLRMELLQQRSNLSEVEEHYHRDLDALALEMGRLKAQSVKINAFGDQIMNEHGLLTGEFDFSPEPEIAIGGLEQTQQSSLETDEFRAYLGQIEMDFDKHERQLGLLQADLSMSKRDADHIPQGQPIEKGWLSSLFGKRIDPFTGKSSLHRGIDFSGETGSNILAVADGVVVWSGPRFGYGTMVEIDHGNGYITRYAHNQKNLVEIGDRVERGKVIALMGRSGRATGTHVHYEVLFNGKRMNPKSFLG